MLQPKYLIRNEKSWCLVVVLFFVVLLGLIGLLGGVGAAVHALQMRQVPEHNFALVVEEVVVGSGHVNRPSELVPLRFRIHFLYGHIVLLAPPNTDSRVQSIRKLWGCEKIFGVFQLQYFADPVYFIPFEKYFLAATDFKFLRSDLAFLSSASASAMASFLSCIFFCMFSMDLANVLGTAR
ncbi:hypothetical protein BpHYR1_037408 [Brachionus plicatilis]|uniref:Uncharacterized protein n=1 Tax=Brachionus plicatilis TaxID=10195 RepID=A0A3M7SQN9_BRAPC|nr:hypothetical protein BpHYR1_037408 [Brachionus plicatilis]